MPGEYISQEKKKALEDELFFLKNKKRRELAENLQRARALGDLSENAEYHAVREEQAISENRIKQIEYILKNAKIIDEKDLKKNRIVAVGSKVEIIKKTKNGRWETETKIIEIVGGEESDMLANKVSFKSPLGSALLEKSKDTEVRILTPKGEMIYKIIKIIN